MRSITYALIVFMLISFSFRGSAQFGNVVVFAPAGEKFTLYFGNSPQNSEPTSRVESPNPGGPSFKIKIIFSDPSIKEISKLVFNKPHSTLYYKVGKNPKGVYSLESGTSEWMDEGVAKPNDKPEVTSEGSETENQPVAGNPDKKATSKSGKNTGCNNPLNEVDFAFTLAGISNHPFEGSKLSAAKKMAETHCLLVTQVKEVMNVFDLESSRLSFAKHAYSHTHNPDEYGDLKEALHSEKSKDDLDRFISAKTR